MRPTRRPARARALIATAATAAATIVVLLSAAAPASALGTMVCAGSTANVFTPAVTNTPQTVRIDQTFLFSGCLGGPVSSGRAGVTLTLTISCSSLLSGGAGSQEIAWLPSGTSRFEYVSTTQTINGQGVIIRTGTITSGLYAGATAIQQTTLLGSLTDCATRGLGAVSGPLVFTLLAI